VDSGATSAKPNSVAPRRSRTAWLRGEAGQRGSAAKPDSVAPRRSRTAWLRGEAGQRGSAAKAGQRGSAAKPDSVAPRRSRTARLRGEAGQRGSAAKPDSAAPRRSRTPPADQPRPRRDDQVPAQRVSALLVQLDDVPLDYAGDAIGLDEFQLRVRRHGAWSRIPSFEVSTEALEELFYAPELSSSPAIQSLWRRLSIWLSRSPAFMWSGRARGHGGDCSGPVSRAGGAPP